MKQKAQVSTLAGFVVIAVATFVLFGGAFTYQYFAIKNVDNMLKASLQMQVNIKK